MLTWGGVTYYWVRPLLSGDIDFLKIFFGGTIGYRLVSALERDCDKKSSISCHDLLSMGNPIYTVCMGFPIQI